MAESRLRIVFLTQTYPRHAGDTSGPFIRDLARALVRGGDEVTVLAPHARGVAAGWDDDGVTVRTFRYAPAALEVIGYSRSLDADETIRPLAGLVTPLYLLAARRAVARACRRGDCDLVQAHWVVPNALAAAGATGTAPLAVGLHGSDVFVAERRGVRRLTAAALARTAVLTGCSPELVERVCALGFPPARAHVIPYGVDSRKFAPGAPQRCDWRERLGIPATATVLLSVGRMATKKGYQVLVPELPGLLARHPGLHVVLAGAGDRLPAFRSALAGEPRVHFPGAVGHDDLPDLFRAADLFTLPAVHDSRRNVDGLPNVILEAMASALPVVATAVSGIPQAVRPEETGLLVAEGDGPGLAAALDRLLAAPELRQRLGTGGRSLTERELTWDQVAARYRAAYLEGLAGGVSRA